jgi:hypothetical protein
MMFRLSVGVGFQDTVDRSLLDGPIGACTVCDLPKLLKELMTS